MSDGLLGLRTKVIIDNFQGIEKYKNRRTELKKQFEFKTDYLGDQWDAVSFYYYSSKKKTDKGDKLNVVVG